MNQNDVITAVHEIFIEGFEVEMELLTAEAKLGEDLGLDSLDGVDLVVAVEKQFGCQIPEDEARSMQCLQDIYDYIETYVNGTERPSGQ